MREALLRATRIGEPLRVESDKDVAWDEVADLVVVGFGGAGAAVALEGAEQGLNVMIVDRFEGGGATSFSGGIYYATETAPQRDAGVQDSTTEMFQYLRAEGTPVREETLRRFCEDSPGNFEWVSRHVPYSGALYSEKATYPPEGKFLYYSGNEKSEEFAKVAKPAARGHRAVGAGWTGYVFYAGLRQAALSAGARLVTHAPARRLIMDAKGDVIGIEVHAVPEELKAAHQAFYTRVNPHVPLKGKQAQKAIDACAVFEAQQFHPRRIRARGGVVLAAGGFIQNRALLEMYRGEIGRAYDKIMRLGTAGCDGSGIALGVSAGGHFDLARNMFIGKTLSPPPEFLHGILVNRHGRRFIAEDAYVSLVGNAIADQPDDGFAYLVMDSRTFWSALRRAATYGKGMFLFFGLPVLINVALGGTKRARSPAALARKLGVDAVALHKTLDEYNRCAASGEKDALGKLPANIAPIMPNRYYAINMSVKNRFGLTQIFTLGGLQVDEYSGQVAGPDLRSIAGLYAAGRTAIGLCSKGYVSGMSLADLVFSGRRAARHVAARMSQER